MTRYITRWYITNDPDEAQRLAAIDRIPAHEIKTKQDVEPLHIGEGWSYWSDGRLIKQTWGGARPPVTSLTRDAVRLIDLVMGSDTGHVHGGWERLVHIDKVLDKQLIAAEPGYGHYAGPTIEQLRVRWLDGTEQDLYTYSRGYFEGYQFDIYASLESLRSGM